MQDSLRQSGIANAYRIVSMMVLIDAYAWSIAFHDMSSKSLSAPMARIKDFSIYTLQAMERHYIVAFIYVTRSCWIVRNVMHADVRIQRFEYVFNINKSGTAAVSIERPIRQILIDIRFVCRTQEFVDFLFHTVK